MEGVPGQEDRSARREVVGEAERWRHVGHSWGSRCGLAAADETATAREWSRPEEAAEVALDDRGSEQRYGSWEKARDHVVEGQDQTDQVGEKDLQDQVRSLVGAVVLGKASWVPAWG
jgi:hypothetical protein